jgi:hypothetical protein
MKGFVPPRLVSHAFAPFWYGKMPFQAVFAPGIRLADMTILLTKSQKIMKFSPVLTKLKSGLYLVACTQSGTNGCGSYGDL